MDNDRKILLEKIADLEDRLAESEQLIDAIKMGEVDAFAINLNDQSEVFTLQSGDYAYRLLIEEFGEGAVNIAEDGLIVYTNSYFFELLKLSYERIVGCYFIDFVEPESLDVFKTLLEQAKDGKSRGEINLLVEGKLIPVYISLTSLQPKLPTIGIIITDLTQKKKQEAVILQYQHDLEAKNSELLQSNADLASFAFIASHDLQEPLRKIQTFTNRLLESEYEHFSDMTRNYFSRITASSRQMQDLINALLDYSRVNTSKNIFTDTNLNELLADVKENLAQLIEEKKAILEIGDLPSLKIIPHQFTQLFTNLIVNAIKYGKENLQPHIKIQATTEKITETIDTVNLPPHQTYWNIQLIDNGIGFDQAYNEKIFELFQRLHSRSEYEGTGIGLAICKKIVQNHNGYIKANGKTGVGATFSIYLPLAR